MHLVDLALYAWVLVVLSLFALLRPRHAVLAAYIGAWLFLPMYGIKIKVFPDLTKVTVTSMSVLLGAFLFDGARILSFRPRWFDIPMAVWCFCPFVTSIINGLGSWDGGSAVIQNLVLWGFPYFTGRIYFSDWEGIRDLAMGLFIGGLIYVPFCLIEVKMSPQFHRWIYGYHQHQFAQTFRLGGWRPMVFMQHGLAVGMWMTTCTLVGIWLWMSKSLRELWGIPISYLVATLLVTTVLCRSSSSMLLLLLGVAIIFWIYWFKNAIPLLCIMAAIPVYVLLRTAGDWSGDKLVTVAETILNEDRAQSLAHRLKAEDLLKQKALWRPGFGWGRWNRSRVYDDKGKDVAVTDSLWVIALGTTGIVGLTSVTLAVLLPILLYRYRCPVQGWMHPMGAAGAAMAMLLAFHMIDNLLNAMLNPIFILAAGGLSAVGLTQQVARRPAYAPSAVPQSTGRAIPAGH